MATDSSATSTLREPLLKEEGEDGPITKPPKAKITFRDIGIWTIMDEVSIEPVWSVSGQSLINYGKETSLMLPLVYTFLKECYDVAPFMMIIYLSSTLWSSTQNVAGLYFSSRLLNIIQKAITDQTVDAQELTIAILCQLGFSTLNTILVSWRRKIKMTLSGRIRYLFDARVMKASLNLDLPSFEDPQTTTRINHFFGYGGHGGAWQRFEDLIRRLSSFSDISSQLLFLFGAVRSQPGGHWFVVLCLATTISELLSYQSGSLRSRVSYTWDSNPHYRRMSSLLEMVKRPLHRVELRSIELQIEWSKARTHLGDTSDEYPDRSLDGIHRPILGALANSLKEEIPLIFYALMILGSPTNFSLASVALMQQASSTLTDTLYSIFMQESSIRDILKQIKELYEIGDHANKIVDGKLSYPSGNEISKGMEIKFENVSFAYPKASDKDVIRNTSFTIQKGQTVVIVGVNGSGKSTLLKLFNRLYDATSGTISIDGAPINSYIASDVRRSAAMLYQTYSHYPLSIRENISLGLPDVDLGVMSPCEKENEDPVREAARLGGALELADSQSKGFDTVLRPHMRGYSSSFSKGSQTFQDKVEELSKYADVSAGQWQRLALSRLFLRASGENIKLIAVDEPSASLDPKMEYELFERLRSLSTEQGKTMVYVTHRFGYLTKRADLILVMQKGQIVEQGRHADLLTMSGEYAKLYNIQAKAFLLDGDNVNAVNE
ncbi:P-loop containing nucleoside triphosphate hydrolase protein [Hysterangium stoloniferum]|nr:P-loop containing nucleoside triphosphate hydrolase protein [Hysterangium stoloniferum]